MLQKGLFITLIISIAFIIFLFKSTNQPQPIESQVETNNSPLTLTIVAHRVAGGHKFATKRHREDITQVINDAQQIWNQANIVLEVKIIDSQISDSTIKGFIEGNFNAVIAEDFYQQGVINIFFINNLPANGIAIYPNTVFVNDTTTVNDFRATAHEIGHLLGLQHTKSSTSRLLFQGVNGTLITEEEIELSRRGTENFLPNLKEL